MIEIVNIWRQSHKENNRESRDKWRRDFDSGSFFVIFGCDLLFYAKPFS